MISTKVKESLGPLFPILNNIRLAYLRFKLRGNRVECACCKHTYKEFAPFGNDRRQNAWCPNCESLERHRLLWMYFEKKTNIYTANLKLLHIAPETVFFHKFKKQKNSPLIIMKDNKIIEVSAEEFMKNRSAYHKPKSAI